MFSPNNLIQIQNLAQLFSISVPITWRSSRPLSLKELKISWFCSKLQPLNLSFQKDRNFPSPHLSLNYKLFKHSKCFFFYFLFFVLLLCLKFQKLVLQASLLVSPCLSLSTNFLWVIIRSGTVLSKTPLFIYCIS